NAGTVNANGGFLNFTAAGATHTGTFNVAAGASLDVNGDFSSAARVCAAAGGTMRFIPVGNRTFDGTLAAAGANVGFITNLPGGSTTFSPTSSVNLDGANVSGFASPVTFNNTQVLSPANIEMQSSGATFNNPRLNVSGVFTVGASSQDSINTTNTGASR